MSDEFDLAVDSLTLPELVTAAEHARRRIIEHLQYDMLPKAKALSESQETDPTPIVNSQEFTRKMVSQWDSCCQEIQQRINRILEES